MDTSAIDWYNRRYVKLEIVKAVKHREMAFLNTAGDKCVRDLSGWNDKYLDWTFQAFRFFDSDYRIYRSVGQLKHKSGSHPGHYRGH